MARKDGKDRGLFEKKRKCEKCAAPCAKCGGKPETLPQKRCRERHCPACKGAGKVGTGVWWICWQGTDRRIHVKKVGAKAEAQRAYHRVKANPEEALPPDKRRPRTVGEAIESYLRESKSSKRSWKDDQRYGDVWKAYLGPRLLGEVTGADIESWRQLRMKRPPLPKPATLNRHVAFLKRVYNVAIEHDLCERNPATRVKLLREENTRIRYLTDIEEKRLRAELEPDGLWHYVAVALHTGLRQAEQMSLRWEYVDLNLNVLRIPRSKTGEPRAVELNAVAFEALRALPSRNRSEWVYPAPAGPKRGKTARVKPEHLTWPSIRVAFETAVKSAKIPNFRWHDLRHTFASRLVMRGVDLRTVMDLMGHRTLSMVQRYAHLTPDHRQNAVSKLVDFDRNFDSAGSQPVAQRS